MRAYKGFLKDFYRIEIINDETNEIVDYIDENSPITPNPKRQKLIKEIKEEKEKIEMTKYPNNLFYQFKFYLKDGTVKLSNTYAENPLSLIHAFEEVLDKKTYDKIIKENYSIHQILELAMKIYNKNQEYTRIEIINNQTHEVIDFIEASK